MKRYLKISFMFLILGLACGVYYREFTKIKNFNGRTMLSMVHPHVIALGFFWLLVLSIFTKLLSLDENKKLVKNDILYFIGLTFTFVMMLYRGTMEVAGLNISNALSASISGLAGIGHILTAIGLIRYILILKKNA